MDILNEFEKYLVKRYTKPNMQDNNTIKAYYSDMKYFFNYYKTEFDEEIITFARSNLIEFTKHLKDKGYKFSTINRKIASLSIYEDFLIDAKIKKNDKIIKKSDYYYIERPFITSDMMPKKTIRKIKQKAEAKNIRDYAILVVLNNAGLRVSELTHIEIKRDLELDSRRITILGKGNKVRLIFIDDLMYEVINDYLLEREKILKGRENKYLFISNKTANTNKPMGRTSINNILNKYCRETNEKKIHPHLLRHDCATNWYEEGCSDLMLKKFLGHSSNATEIYTHQGGEKLKKNN